MRRSAPLRHYVYVLLTIWAVMALVFLGWTLIADTPTLPILIPLLVVSTVAGIVAVRAQR
jgi:hypothetical protein